MICHCQCGLCDCEADDPEPFADWARIGEDLGAHGAADAFEELERALDGDALHQLRIAFARGKRSSNQNRENSHAKA